MLTCAAALWFVIPRLRVCASQSVARTRRAVAGITGALLSRIPLSLSLSHTRGSPALQLELAAAQLRGALLALLVQALGDVDASVPSLS